MSRNAESADNTTVKTASEHVYCEETTTTYEATFKLGPGAPISEIGTFLAHLRDALCDFGMGTSQFRVNPLKGTVQVKISCVYGGSKWLSTVEGLMKTIVAGEWHAPKWPALQLPLGIETLDQKQEHSDASESRI